MCRADGVFMGAPFLAYAGGVTKNQTLLQLGYDQVRLYRDVLVNTTAPTGLLWAHLYDEDGGSFWDPASWATGNAWAALGAVHVLATIQKSAFAGAMAPQAANLTAWAGDIVNGTLLAATASGLIPDYIAGNPNNFGDASASGALAAVYYRLAVLAPKQFGPRKTPVLHAAAEKIRNVVRVFVRAYAFRTRCSCTCRFCRPWTSSVL
jgi:rhamnogalacturonyl hydrolase YesR